MAGSVTRAVAAVLLFLSLGTHQARGDRIAPPSEKPAETKGPSAHVTGTNPTSGWPLSGSISLVQNLGMGTFSEGAGELSRPYYNLLLTAQGAVRVPGPVKASLGLRVEFDVNVVENFDSTGTRPNQVHFGDIRLFGEVRDLLTHSASNLSLSGGLNLQIPTSLMSQFASKILGVRLHTTLDWRPIEGFSLRYAVAGTKNFNTRTSTVLDWDDFDSPRLSRPGGAENVAAGLTATGGAVIEWALAHTLSTRVVFLQDFSFAAEFSLLTAWTYPGTERDGFTSPHAATGRGQRDLTYGSLEVNWNIRRFLSLGLGSVVAQEPKTADNTGFRFPFWDTSNGSANRQVLYLSVTGSL